LIIGVGLSMAADRGCWQGCRSIKKINAAAKFINAVFSKGGVKMPGMKASSRLAQWFAWFALGLPLLTSCAPAGATIPDRRLVGQWRQPARFTGICYEEAVQKKVVAGDLEAVWRISADGQVTGHIGGAELSGCSVAVNRGWLGRRLHLKTDFVLRGQLIGAVAPGSESGTHTISAPFNLDGSQLGGTVFVLRPFIYPYPFLNLKMRPEP